MQRFVLNTGISLLWLLGIAATTAEAQTSSFYGSPGMRHEAEYRMTLANSSLYYIPPPQPREFRLHDQVTVIVDYKSQVISEGESEREKKSKIDAKLEKWTLWRGWSWFTDPMSEGIPTVKGKWDTKQEADGSIETRDAMAFKIACRIVDKRPNGLLVLEGRKWIRNNDEQWVIELTGVIRPEDVLPNNTVLEQNVAELQIAKAEDGTVRDSYRRGFLTKFMDLCQPF